MMNGCDLNSSFNAETVKILLNVVDILQSTYKSYFVFLAFKQNKRGKGKKKPIKLKVQGRTFGRGQKVGQKTTQICILDHLAFPFVLDL